MLPTMVEETLKKIVSNNKESNNTAPRAMKRRPGRKSGYKKPQVVAEKVIAEAPVVAEKVEVVTEVM
jgi:hypothetical protein